MFLHKEQVWLCFLPSYYDSDFPVTVQQADSELPEHGLFSVFSKYAGIQSSLPKQM
jgi:hypothetical protein